MKFLIYLFFAAAQACNHNSRPEPKKKPCKDMKLKCPGNTDKYAYVKRTRKGDKCIVDDWKDLTRTDSKNVIDKYCKDSTPLSDKCWDHILPNKTRPCSIPTEVHEFKQIFKNDLLGICPEYVIDKVARVLKRVNEEVIIKTCHLQPSCLIHDRCFLIVDNHPDEGYSHAKCNTDQKNNMMTIAHQRKNEDWNNRYCPAVVNFLYIALNAADGCKFLDFKCFGEQIGESLVTGSWWQHGSAIYAAKPVWNILVEELDLKFHHLLNPFIIFDYLKCFLSGSLVIALDNLDYGEWNGPCKN